MPRPSTACLLFLCGVATLLCAQQPPPGQTQIPTSPAGDITVEAFPAGAKNLLPFGDMDKSAEGGTHPVGWGPVDNLVWRWVKDPDPARGGYIRIETDIAQSVAYEWWKGLFLHGADLSEAPRKVSDTSYSCIGGLDGGFYMSDLIPIKEGRAYKVYVDARGPMAKVFAFGYVKKVPLAFADEQPAVQQLLREARGEPSLTKEGRQIRYMRRYMYRRWFAVGGDTQWKTYTHHMPMHPTGRELTQDVRYLRIMIYPYWPPATYEFDNVRVVEVEPWADQGKPESLEADVEEGKVVK